MAAPPSDVFPALFSALRGRLAAHTAPSPAATPTRQPSPLSAFSCASDALLTSLAASDSCVSRSISEQIRHDASANRLELLRRRRLGARKHREVKRRQRQWLDAVAAVECDAVLQDAETYDLKFQFFMAETHAKAAARLQTLFFECIAEMKKALVRMESVAADNSEESESRVEELRRRYDWQFFLARLQQDCGGDVDTSLLIPGPSGDKSSSSASVKAVLQRTIHEHGPALEDGQALAVRSVVSLRRAVPARRAPEKSSRRTPSLHFGTSAAETWTELLESMLSPTNTTKPKRATSASSSTRRIRRLPPSRGAATALSESASVFSTNGGVCSTFRQLASEGTPQFPGTACDVLLSSAYIRWMLTRTPSSRGSANDDGGATNDLWLDSDIADSNIYFDTAEYEQNFAAVMQNYATSAAMDDTATQFPVNHAVLASARRSLREISAILERSRGQKETLSADTIFASRQMRSGDSLSNEHSAVVEANPTEADGEPGVFARASVLQLVQTLYYSNKFLALLPSADVDTLRKLYPTALFGEGCLSTLYVPVVGGVSGRNVTQDEATVSAASHLGISMSPLDDPAIHELLLVYVARGRHGLAQEKSPSANANQQLTSLALSDAVSRLAPRRQEDSNQRIGARLCMIRNPRGLWEQDKEQGQQPASSCPEEIQRFRDTDTLFVEYTISSTELGVLGPPRQSIAPLHSKVQALMEILGTFCMWRSCITPREAHELQSNASLCRWHASVERFLEADEAMQYTPIESRMYEAFLSGEGDSLADKTKRAIQTSSSLLEELSSRHLSFSIKAFYEHVVGAASNRGYQKELLDAMGLDGFVNGDVSVTELEQSHHELQRLVDLSDEVLGSESCVTRELQQLLQLTVYPGVEDSFVQHGFVDLEELQSDIRTRDLELLLRLSHQKLQILKRRRRDEEKQVARRLAPSTSLPSMSFHSALEQAGLNSPEVGPSSVYDVIHVMRKGRQSLLRQQHHHQSLNGAARTGSKRAGQPAPSLERCASDLAYRVSPYDTKAAPTAKYRANDGSSGKRTVRKNSNR